MDFYNAVIECSENFNMVNKNISSNCVSLKKSWEGPASLKFFSKIDEVKEILSILKSHFSLYEAAGSQTKVLEEVIEKLKLKKAQQSNLEKPDLNLNSEIILLEKEKKKLINEIEEYFDTISSLNSGSIFIDIKMSSSKKTFEKASKVNNISEKKEVTDVKKEEESVENFAEKNNTISTNEKTSSSVNFSKKVGTVISNPSNYNNDAAKGQCVWYVRGRAVEKLGKDTGAVGNGNQMALNCNEKAKLSATKENIKDDIIVSYRYGTSAAGQKYGHVIYIEKVEGEKVYYTECKTVGNPAGTLKETTKDAIINGTAGCGTGVVGFIDVNKL